MTSRAAIYVRISRDSEKDGLGVARQRRDCEALAARLGWQVTQVFEDNDVSASKVTPRPAYERMVAAIRGGLINAVIVWDVDRLTRQPRELEDVIDFANQYGLRLASVGGETDLATEQGRMMARMKGTVARYEAEQLGRRARAKAKELAEAGAHTGPRPYGWQFGPDRRLVVDEDEVAVLRECAERVLRGEGLWRIVNDLNARGVKTSRGGPWATQVLRRVLLRPRNAGLRTHQGEITGAGQWAPLWDEDYQARLTATLTDPARKSNNRGTAPRYLGTGIYRCGVCSGPLVGVCEHTYTLRSGRTRTYPAAYKCPAAGCMKVTRPMAPVDALVNGVVEALLDRDGVRLLGGDPVVADEARARAATVEARLAGAADQYAGGAITADQLARITARLRPELDRERARAAAAMPSGFDGEAGSALWAKADVETRKKILRVVGMVVTVEPVGAGNGRTFDPDSVRIDWERAHTE